jgi:bleomycin hydrolase
LFKEVEKRADSIKAAEDSVTAAVHSRQKKAKDLRDSTATELRFDISKIVRPAFPDEFKSVFHFPPTPQDMTGTCWSFSGTSFIESEVYRLTSKKIKLSEMYTVYWEWVEKVRRFVRERGESEISAGSEEEALPRIIKQYGAVPRDVFYGLKPDFPHYVHNDLDREISQYTNYVRDHNLWDEDAVLTAVRIILDKYIGKPPETFEYEGAKYTPKQFATEVLKINPDDYVCAMSTLKVPFHAKGLFEAGDNWQRDSSYYNLPLDEWYGIIKNAIQRGYSVAIGGGTAEPGYYGMENLGVIPDFDIPQNYINQDSREYRIYRGTTGDDHGLHLVGYERKGNRDWFLIKDSGSGSRKGKLIGYFFFRDDYLRLKMLTFMVHKDAMQGPKDNKKKL